MNLTRFDDPAADAFRAEIRSWLTSAIPREWVDGKESLTPERAQVLLRSWDHALFEAGYSGLAWPTEYGGRGYGPIEEVIFFEEAARANAPEGFGRVGRILAGPTLIAAGTDAQKNRYLPRILDGTEVWCQGFSEPGAGSDLAALRASAVKVPGGYRVTGQKTWTSFAQEAKRCLTLVRTSGEGPRHHDLTFLLLDMEQEGVEIIPIEQINGDVEFSDVFFDEVFVPNEDRVGKEDEGWAVAMTVLTNERGTTEAATRLVDISTHLGVLERCCATSPHVVDCERLAVRGDLLRWQILRASEEKASGLDWFAAGSTLKIIWSELVQDVTRLGIDTGCPVHRKYWRYRYLQARAMSIYSGTNEIQRNIITDRVLKVVR